MDMDNKNISNDPKNNLSYIIQKPTVAFIGASWCALFIGFAAYLIGLWNAAMELNEKGYYFILIMYGLFSAVSLQKSVRDKIEKIQVSRIYFGICWVSLCVSLLLLAIGLYNASLELSEKGFYAISFLLCLYASVAVQKNVRDLSQFPSEKLPKETED